MANENILNDGNELLEQASERLDNLPDTARGVSQPGTPPSVLEGANIVSMPAEQPTLPETSQLQQLRDEAASAVDVSSPIPYRPYTYSLPRPVMPATADPANMRNDLDFLNTLSVMTGQQEVPGDAYAIGELANSLQSTTDFYSNNGLGQFNLVPATQANWQNNFEDVIENAWANRAATTQNQTVAPGNTPLLGITRSLNDGQPFTGPSEESAIDFFRRTFGVDFTGVDSGDREEVAAPNAFDRFMSSVRRSASRVLSPVGQVFDFIGVVGEVVAPETTRAISGALDTVNPITATPGEIGAGRRILQTFADVAAGRVSNRIDEVGLGSFIGENTIGRLPNPNRFVSSLANSIRRGENPIQPFFPPQEFVGSGIRQQPQAEDLSLIQEAIQRSPDLRNFLRDMSPVINEAGEVGFNPAAGEFGEFGSAGSLSSLLWLMNIPEGLLQGALYDASDLIRYVNQNERVSRLLGNVPVLGNLIGLLPENDLPQANLERIDTLGALFGRDYGFTQDYSEDRYLGIIGNPALRWIPQGYGLQTGLGFALDVVTGGISDALIVDPLFSTGARGARTAASELIEEGTERAARSVPQPSWRPLDGSDTILQVDIPGPTRLQIDTVLQPSSLRQVDDVLQRSPITNVIADINDTVNRSVRTGIDEVTSQAVMTGAELRRLNNIDNVEVLRRLDDSRFQRSLRELSVTRPIQALQDSPLDKVIRTIDNVPTDVNVQRITDIGKQLDEMPSMPGLADADQQRYTRIVRNFNAERRALLSTLTEPQQVADVVRSELTRVIKNSDGNVALANGSIIIQRTPTQQLDDFLSPVPISTVTPRSVSSVSEGLLAYRVVPQQIEPLSVVPTRRSIESINSLANLTGLKAPLYEPVDTLSTLSNFNRLESLSVADPELFSVYGKPLSSNINQPIRRVDLSQYDGLTISVVPEQSANAGLLPRYQPSLEGVSEARSQVRRLANRYPKVERRLSEATRSRDDAQMIAAQGELNSLQASIKEIYADYPEVALLDTIEALPPSLAPAGVRSQQIVEDYVVAQREFMFETGQLRKLREDLAQTDRLLQQQREVLSRLPRLERIDPSNELSTQRRFGNSQRYGTSEKLQPTGDINVPGLETIIREQGGTVSLPYLRRMPELEQLTKAQQDQVFRNQLNLQPPDSFVSKADVDEFGVDGMFYATINDVPNLNYRVLDELPDDVSVYFHGTKATRLDNGSFSLTNELGPGLYVTPFMDDAYKYARAKPAEDLVDIGDLRPKFTNQGRVFPIGVPNTYNPLNLANEAQVEELKDIFRANLKEYLPDSLRRFDSWRRRHPPEQWWLYVRSQFLKEQNSQVNYIKFVESVRNNLTDNGYDAIRKGNTLNIISDNRLVASPFEDISSEGSIMEGLLNRYEVDLQLQARLINQGNQSTISQTTQAILEQDRLAIDTFARQQLAEQVIKQERITTDVTRRMNKIELELDDAVHQDTVEVIAKQLDEGEADAVRKGARALRDEAKDSYCP